MVVFPIENAFVALFVIVTGSMSVAVALPSGTLLLSTEVASNVTLAGGVSFGAIQGSRYSCSGLQMVVGSVNSNQLILYLKSATSDSKPIISPATEANASNATISIVHLPTPTPSTKP